MKENKQLVTVYGTLRKDCSNHRLLEKATYKGTFESKPIFNMYSMNDVYPALKLGGTTSVLMEVYEVTDKQLKAIDGLEGYHPDGKANLYDRKKIFTPYGESYLYIYEGNCKNDKKIKLGDWKEYIILNQVNELVTTY